MAGSSAPILELSDDERALLYRLQNNIKNYHPKSEARNTLVSNLLNGTAEVSNLVKREIVAREFRTKAGAEWGYRNFEGNYLLRLVQTIPFDEKNQLLKSLLLNKNLSEQVLNTILAVRHIYPQKLIIELLTQVDDSIFPMEEVTKIISSAYVKDGRPVATPKVETKSLLQVIRQRASYPDDIPDEWIVNILCNTDIDDSDLK